MIAAATERIPTIGGYAMPGMSNAGQLVQFDLAGIAVSAGSACSSGSMKPSRVLAAMGISAEIAGSVIRVSFGPRHERRRRRSLSDGVASRCGTSRYAGRMIYLDYQATTPVAPEVAEAMRPWAENHFANPHSPSRWGREAAAAIEVARDQVETAIGLTGGSLAFTGSATEAINWALKGTMEQASGRNRIVTIATEHAAVLDSCEWLEAQGCEVVRLPVGPDGLVALGDVKTALDDRVAIVAAMLVNNEIGVIQPVAEIAALAHEVGALMLCDAVQGLGRVPIPQGPDLVAVSAHKIHGPKAIGALWMREGAEPAPFVHGGGQERGLRSGTLSPALCVGFGAAARLASKRETTITSNNCGRPRLPPWGLSGLSMAASASATTATSTSAASGSTRRG